MSECVCVCLCVCMCVVNSSDPSASSSSVIVHRRHSASSHGLGRTTHPRATPRRLLRGPPSGKAGTVAPKGGHGSRPAGQLEDPDAWAQHRGAPWPSKEGPTNTALTLRGPIQRLLSCLRRHGYSSYLQLSPATSVAVSGNVCLVLVSE